MRASYLIVCIDLENAFWKGKNYWKPNEDIRKYKIVHHHWYCIAMWSPNWRTYELNGVLQWMNTPYWLLLPAQGNTQPLPLLPPTPLRSHCMPYFDDNYHKIDMDFLVQHGIQRLYDHTPYGTQIVFHQKNIFPWCINLKFKTPFFSSLGLLTNHMVILPSI